MRKLIFLGIAMLVVMAGYKSFEHYRNASEAYIFAFPLLIMAETEKHMSSSTGKNQFVHARSLPNHESRIVVKPNNDTLYSSAWFDLAGEAQIIAMPAMLDRYYVLPFMDAWSNVFRSVGTRTNNNSATNYALVGPQWQGQTPENTTLIRSPTNRVWLIARIEIDKLSSISNLFATQDKMKIYSESNWPHGLASKSHINTATEQKSKPPEIIGALSSNEFFARLSKQLSTQALAFEDPIILQKLRTLGVVAGKPYKENQLFSWLHQKAINEVRQRIKLAVNNRAKTSTGWSLSLDDLGRYGTNYLKRASVALTGLGALAPEDAIYPSTSRDANDKPLSGSHSYRLHFEANEIPPADAFWSLTVYDENGYMTENSINRYRLGSNNKLHWNSDGSLDIDFSHHEPDVKNANWLPLPKGLFSVTMRLYQPTKKLLDGQWQPPLLEKQSLR